MKSLKIIILIHLIHGIGLHEVFGLGIYKTKPAVQVTNGFISDSVSSDSIPESQNDNKIISLAKAYEDSIVLRIAPPYFVFWEDVMRSGFIIKRGTSKDKLTEIAKIFPFSEEKKLSKENVNDSIAQAAFHLLYGKIDKSGLIGYKLYNANENILGMAMLISEFSAKAAQILGFRFVDRNVIKGQKYFYEISSPEYPDNKNKALIEVVNNFIPSDKPLEFEVRTGDNYLRLEWPKNSNQNNFTYYKIERSTDSINYFPITERPLFFNKTKDSLSAKFIFTDSIDIVNNQKYFYRLFGGNSFAEYSPPAIAYGTPRDLTPPKSLELNKVEFNVDLNEFSIEWDIDIEKMDGDFDYYQIMMSRHESEGYKPISAHLGLSDFFFTYSLGNEWKEENEGRYFFRIDCYDENGNRSQSSFYNSFVPDFTDPKAPDSLYGFVDSLSFAHLSWSKSDSKDVRGYWLYWGNNMTEELALVSKDIIKDTSYKYYIPDKSLTKKIYYVVRAEDFAYNRSETSNVAVVKRLDKIPPVRPSIKTLNTDSLFVKLNLALSSSEDVHYHEIYRRKSIGKDTIWVLLDTIFNESQVSDYSVELNEHYQYKMRAVDSTGNMSPFSPIKTATIRARADLTMVTDFKVKSFPKENKSELEWSIIMPKKMHSEPYAIEIYRSTGQSGVTLYKTVEKGISNIFDDNLATGVLYNYAIRVKYDNSWTGDLSEVKSILIK